MTKTEAATLLRSWHASERAKDEMEPFDTALQMAIEALEREDAAKAEEARAVPREPTEAMHGALARAESWIRLHPHGDNCYLSNHYEGDPGNRCNCGKESLLGIIDAAIDAARATPGRKG